jgi:intein/homing endonuclease
MAYVLGFLYADGSITKTKRNTHFVSLHIADKQLLYDIRAVLGAEHVISKRSARTGAVYRLQIGSREWYDDLVAIGLVPGKAKRMKVPAIPARFVGDFVRGYFDGDGNVWTGEIHKARPVPHQTLLVAFTSASKDFLVGLQNLLQTAGVEGGSCYTSSTKSFSRLQYSKHAALQIYKIMYNSGHKLYLPRKKHVFEKFLTTE